MKHLNAIVAYHTIEKAKELLHESAQADSVQRPGWAVRGKRWNVEKELMDEFRSPPEPHTYPEEVAKHMRDELARLHDGWEWEIIPPND